MKGRRISAWLMSGVLCAFLCVVSGCGAFELVTGSDGQPHTRIETALGTAGKVIGGVSGFVPVPGAKIIGGGLAVIMGLAGHSITSVVVSRRRNTALSTVIKGVEVGAGEIDKLRDSIVAMLGGAGVGAAIQGGVHDLFVKASTIKSIIYDVSKLVENKDYLDSKVQQVVGKMG